MNNFIPEDGDSMFLQTVAINLRNHMAPKPKKTPAFKFLPASLCDAFNNV
jgi:hypothetical protein